MGYNLINTIACVFCAMINLSQSMPGWEMQEKCFCGSGDGRRVPSLSTESLEYPESL